MAKRGGRRDPGWERFDEIWQALWQGLGAPQASHALGSLGWRRAVRIALLWLWALTWRGFGWALYLAFLFELRCLSDPPLLDFLPLFKSLLGVMLCVFAISLTCGGWPFPPDEDITWE